LIYISVTGPPQNGVTPVPVTVGGNTLSTLQGCLGQLQKQAPPTPGQQQGQGQQSGGQGGVPVPNNANANGSYNTSAVNTSTSGNQQPGASNQTTTNSSSCPSLQPTVCNQHPVSNCQKTGLFTSISNITCNSVLPPICDVTSTTSAAAGTNWIINCGQWVVQNFLYWEKINMQNLLNLCQVVSNTTTSGTASRRELQGSSNVSTVALASDPTATDTAAQVPASSVQSATSNVTVDGSTSTTASGATSAKVASINQVGSSVSSSFRYGVVSAFLILFVSLF